MSCNKENISTKYAYKKISRDTYILKYVVENFKYTYIFVLNFDMNYRPQILGYLTKVRKNLYIYADNIKLER